jgi:hypothetical protein
MLLFAFFVRGCRVKTYTVAWFSAGVSSAVATKLAIAQIDEVIYTHIDDQHSDTMRFVKDCEAWFGKPVTVLQSRIKCVDHAMRLFPNQKIHGQRWAPCTDVLKRRVRKEWEYAHENLDLRYVWGMDGKERNRQARIEKAMPRQQHLFPLIERGIGKAEAHEILRASGIRRPTLYEMGYHNNNCLGCCKGNMWYWNCIRRDFPEIFAARAKLEREIGGSMLNDEHGPIYLDELDPKRGRDQGIICNDCGIMCELMALPPSGGDGMANAEAHGRRSRTVQPLVGDLRQQVETMRRIADDTEAHMRGETDAKRIAFYDGRVCCLREQALNIEDIIANNPPHRSGGAERNQ